MEKLELIYQDTLSPYQQLIYSALESVHAGGCMGSDISPLRLWIYADLAKKRLLKFQYQAPFFYARYTEKGNRFFDEMFGKAEEAFDLIFYPTLFEY